MRIVSWNVNGVRSWYKKGCLNWVLEQKPDIFCFQEMKASEDQLPEDLKNISGYKLYMDHSKLKKGYSGVAVYVNEDYLPYKIDTALHVNNPSVLKSVAKSDSSAGPTDDVDHEGRFIALYTKDFVIINCYFPNGGGDSDRLQYKLNFYDSFLLYINKLKKEGKKVIFCGDVNVAHTEIDIARPKENADHVGFLPVERAWIDKVIESGFVDTYRFTHPDTTEVYSWWDLKSAARDRNVGWRIDYIFVDETFKNKLKDVEIHTEVYGSDHCPVSLVI